MITRALFASTRGAGHYGPLLAVAEAIVRGGGEVLFAGPPEIGPAVEKAGHAFRPVGEPPADALAAVWSRVPELTQDEQNALVVGEIFAGLNVEAALPGLRAVCSDWRPDVVLRDPNEYASAIAAAEHGIPHARIAIGLAATEEQGLRIAARVLGEERIAELRHTPFFTAFPRSLDYSGTQPDTRRYRCPALDTAPQALPQPTADGDDRPLVYVTFGSVAGSVPQARSVYAAALEAVADLPIRALLTTGAGPDLDELRAAAAPNTRVERWIPQADVLAHATAVVCHGGSGSTLGALAAGLPIVAVPLFADQPANGQRVAAAGAGIAVAPDAGAIRAALAEVLANPAYPRRAQALAAEMRAHPLIDHAIDPATEAA